MEEDYGILGLTEIYLLQEELSLKKWMKITKHFMTQCFIIQKG